MQASANQKENLLTDTEKMKRKETKQITIKTHQITKEESKRDKTTERQTENSKMAK